MKRHQREDPSNSANVAATYSLHNVQKPPPIIRYPPTGRQPFHIGWHSTGGVAKHVQDARVMGRWCGQILRLIADRMLNILSMYRVCATNQTRRKHPATHDAERRRFFHFKLKKATFEDIDFRLEVMKVFRDGFV
jgi:hypothetical protein